METGSGGNIKKNKEGKITRRRQLLPWWVIGFIWIFMICAAIIPFSILSVVLDINFEMAIYGLQTYEPLSEIGLALMGIFAYKGIIAYALWTEKDWVIVHAQIDAVLGILICSLVMIYPFIDNAQGSGFNLRLELIVLIPYFIKLRKIKTAWNGFNMK